MLVFAVADVDVDVLLAQLLVRRETVKASDELEVLAERADDHRHQQAAQLDRRGERVDVLCVQLADIARDRDPIRRYAPARG